MINRRKRIQQNEVKLVENVIKNPQSFLQNSPVQKEDPPSHKLQDHAYE